MAVDDLVETHPEAVIYLRGDFNVSKTNPKRTQLLSQFCSQHNLLETFIPKPTYHHFMGDGKSDSNLDRILHSSSVCQSESIVNLECSLKNPLIDSHHDLLISKFFIPAVKIEASDNQNVVAPTLPHTRLKVIWSDDGIEKYQAIVAPQLSRIQELWLSPSSKTSVSLLLESTNNVIASCAAQSNRTIKLGKTSSPRSSVTPKAVRLSQNALLKQNKKLKQSLQNNEPGISDLKAAYNKSRILHRKLERSFKAKDSIARDNRLNFGDLTAVFSSVKRAKRTKAGKIQKLTVGDSTYVGDSVKDGFYDSISQLKTRNTPSLDSCEYFQESSADYKNILELCKEGPTIPPLSEADSFNLLGRLKSDVNDVYGITPNHYNYAGPAGWLHFHLLLNCLLNDVNNTDIIEVNTAYACILFKGHGKEKTSDRSYRTISTCPVIAKALDLYIRDLNISSWNSDQAETQFQGEGSSHELAAILLTETIAHSLFTLKKPVFVLYLDAQSAFDVVLSELLVKNLFRCDTSGHSLLYLNNRFQNRRTVVDWDGELMGPVVDERGVEQGNVNSSDMYKIYGKEQLSTSQESRLGVPLGNLVISSICQCRLMILL